MFTVGRCGRRLTSPRARVRAADRGGSGPRRAGIRADRRAVPRRAQCALLPDARLAARRRGRAPGCAAACLAGDRPLRRPQLAALLALFDLHQHLPELARGPQEARPPDRLRSADRPRGRAGPADRRDRLDRALPRPRARARGRPDRPRRSLRASRGGRAGVHRGTPASAPEPAGRADPARGARLLGPRDGGDARDVRRLGQQRPAARPGFARFEAARPQPAGDAARSSATTASRRSSAPTSTPGTGRTSRASSRC